MSRQFELLEKSASWAEVGGVGVGASQLLNDESAKVKTIRTLPAVGAPAERVLCRMSPSISAFSEGCSIESSSPITLRTGSA